MKIISMLPFLDEESKDELVESILNNELKEGSHVIPAILPFLSNKQIHKLYIAALEKKIDASPYEMLPFVSQEAINEAIDRIESGDLDGVKLERMLPFLSTDNVRKIFKQAFKHYKKSDSDTKEEPPKPTEDKEENE
ncbi:MAG: hypothetical protein ACNA7U_06580 [Candidatus Izemoplasmataceae bacterium]